jgi:ketosteroid isomerase-like protein
MDAADGFRAVVMERFVAAERAMHAGDAGPRIALWSHHDPVTLLGAEVPARIGWAELEPVFRWIAGRFSGVTGFRIELLASGASGDLGYTVAFEHITAMVNGESRQYTLRATHVWRREEGEWKIVHRHGDPPPADSFSAHAGK